jgi:hypothetical protein
MKVRSVLTSEGLARTGGEADRLIKGGAVLMGGCDPECRFFATGYCSCGQWQKVTDPRAEAEKGAVIKVGAGLWRTVARIDGKQGFDQLRGVCRVPTLG